MRKLSRLAAVAVVCLIACAAGAATLLPPGMQTFLDSNGAPIIGGQLYFYQPNTTTLKDTWQDAGQTVFNTNPVVLDGSGRAVIFGTGQYREVLKDRYGNLVWDKVTGDPGATSASWAGIGGGTANAQTVSAPNFSAQDGQSIAYIPAVTNTSAASVNPNGSGPIPVLVDTPGGPVGLTGGEIVANGVTRLTYDASRGSFHIAGAPAQPGGISPITASTTTDLGTILSHFAYVTGTATITSFGSSCSASLPIYYVQFSGGQTITASATIGTPGSANIATAANDTAVAQCLGGGNWRILSYSPAAGANVPSGAVMAFALTSCPSGWAAADGTGGRIDARGVAIRGIDNGRGQDPDGTRAPGALQADALQDHEHTYRSSNDSNFGATNGSGLTNSGTNSSPTTAIVPPPTGPNAGVAPRVASETRMKNVALLYCQKS